jgi:hypothetical protein
MIRTALEFIKTELDTYIANRENDPGNYAPGTIVDLKAIISPNGVVNNDGSTHITITLAGIEEERREGKRPYIFPTDDNKFLTLNAPIEINLHLLFIAHSNDYETALRDLSDVIEFFQANVVFDEQRYPNLNASVAAPVVKPWQLIERLSFRLINLSFEQQNNLWGMFGGKYMPSAVYKMILLTAFDTKSNDISGAVTQLGIMEN